MNGRSMRERVWIGQTWQRRRDKRQFAVRQVHRADRIAELAADGTRLCVSFTDLRRKWELVGEQTTPRARRADCPAIDATRARHSL